MHHHFLYKMAKFHIYGQSQYQIVGYLIMKSPINIPLYPQYITLNPINLETQVNMFEQICPFFNELNDLYKHWLGLNHSTIMSTLVEPHR